LLIFKKKKNKELKEKKEKDGCKIFEKWLKLGFCAYGKVKGKEIIFDLSNQTE